MNKTILIVIGVLAAVGIIVAAVAAAVVFYFVPTSVQTTENAAPQVIETSVPATAEKSFVEYYQTKDQYFNKGMVMKKPEELGLKEIAKVTVACPFENPDGPCGYDLLIFSKEAPHAGTQEFYLGSVGGAGYGYWGPFTDDLTRLVEESKAIDSLKE